MCLVSRHPLSAYLHPGELTGEKLLVRSHSGVWQSWNFLMHCTAPVYCHCQTVKSVQLNHTVGRPDSLRFYRRTHDETHEAHVHFEVSGIWFKQFPIFSGKLTEIIYFIQLKIFKYTCICLATLGLSCGIWDLVPWAGIKPGSPALGVQSLSHWTTREVPWSS